MPHTLPSSSKSSGSKIGFNDPASFADEDILDQKKEEDDDDDDVLGESLQIVFGIILTK